MSTHFEVVEPDPALLDECWLPPPGASWSEEGASFGWMFTDAEQHFIRATGDWRMAVDFVQQGDSGHPEDGVFVMAWVEGWPVEFKLTSGWMEARDFRGEWESADRLDAPRRLIAIAERLISIHESLTVGRAAAQ